MLQSLLDKMTPHQGSVAVIKLIVANLCLITIAVVSCCNATIAFSLAVTCATAIIKVYKLDPEPFFLLSLHTVVSCLMLHDKVTTLAILVASALTCLSAGSIEVSSERIAVFLLSMTFSCLMGRVTASVAAIGLIIAIISIKLRPLTPPMGLVLGLLVLAASVPVNQLVTVFLSLLLAAILTVCCFLKRFHSKDWPLHQDLGESYQNNNYKNRNNNTTAPINCTAPKEGSHLRMSSTTESLDLHGHTVTGALKLLHEFLKEQEDVYRVNRTGHTRYIKVITGEDGKNHPEDNLNLIKPTVANFLKINKYRYQVNPERPGVLRIDLESHVT